MNEPRKDETEERFEQHLRRFRPGAPRALAIPSRRGPWAMLAVPAALLLVISLGVVLIRSRRPDRRIARTAQSVAPRGPMVAIPVTFGKLNAALRTNDQDLNKMLDDASPRLLPREHRGTALFELGKE